MTTKPDNAPASLASLAAAVEAGLERGKHNHYVLFNATGDYMPDNEIAEGITAFNALLARVADRERWLREFVARVVERSSAIDNNRSIDIVAALMQRNNALDVIEARQLLTELAASDGSAAATAGSEGAG